jgi:hypothetical protein
LTSFDQGVAGRPYTQGKDVIDIEDFLIEDPNE